MGKWERLFRTHTQYVAELVSFLRHVCTVYFPRDLYIYYLGTLREIVKQKKNKEEEEEG